MDAPFTIFVAVALLIVFDLAALLYGVDSRDGFGEEQLRNPRG